MSGDCLHFTSYGPRVVPGMGDCEDTKAFLQYTRGGFGPLKGLPGPAGSRRRVCAEHALAWHDRSTSQTAILRP